MSAPNACPICQQTRSVAKVSALYIAGIQAQKAPADLEPPPPVNIPGLPPEALPALSRRLAPPASRKEVPLRLIHPDLAVLVFSALAPVFLTGIYTTQRPFFFPALAGLIAAYGLYFYRREYLLARHERQLAAENARKERIRRGVQRWMNLYYCVEDDVVFEPGGAAPLPADQIHGYLFQD